MFAQEPVSIHLTEKDGLPDIEFYDVLEDSKGFIWLASDSGFYRYDGKTYIQYTNKEKRGLSVFGLVEDSLGRIWCTNISGQFFYIENNKLNTFIDLQEALKGQLASFTVHENYLLINGHYAVYSTDLTTKKVTKIISSEAGLSNVVTFNNTVTFVGFDKTIIFNKHLEKTRQFKNNIHIKTKLGKSTLQGATHVFKINNSFFITQQFNNENIFKKIDFDTQEINETKGLENLKEKRIISITIFNDNLWVLTYTGIYVFENNQNKFHFKKHILKDEIVTKVIIDKDENYWATTLTNGIYLIPNIAVVNYALPKDINDITAINKVNDSILFFGTKKGKVGFFNINTARYSTSKQLKSKVSAIQYNTHKKYSYVSTDKESYIVDNNTLKTTRKSNLQGVKSFSRIDKNTLLFGTYIQLTFLNEVTNLFNKYSNTKRVYTTHCSSANKLIYVAYVDGLVVLDSQLKATNITFDGKEISATSITETKDGTIWIGTFKNGILAIKNNKVVAQYTTENGLLSNETRYLKGDKNQLWVATSKGLQVLNTASKIFKSLTKTEGILSYKISGIEILQNRVVLSSNKGIFSFDKNNVFKTIYPPKIYFNDIKINEKSVEIGTNYHLDYNQNSIQFGFNVNGILYNQNKTYQYRLLGYDNNWVTTDLGVNHIKYNSLPAGNYTFQIKPNQESIIKNIALTIQLPFWKQWWFVMVYSLLLVGFIMFYYNRKLRRKEKSKQREIKQLFFDKELTALKLENLRSQMNPHFVFNALNSIQDYIISNQKDLAGDYLGKFADLIRTYLAQSTKSSITLEEEINSLNMYLELEKLRFEDTLEYTLEVHIKNTETIGIPTMLIQPYIENALKHGLFHKKDNRKLFISMTRISKDSLQCIVEDNGVGRKKSNEINKKRAENHKSFALKATTERLDLLNYGSENKIGVHIIDILDNDKNVLGTRVLLKIPILKVSP